MHLFEKACVIVKENIDNHTYKIINYKIQFVIPTELTTDAKYLKQINILLIY